MIKILILSCGTNACYHFSKTLKSFFKNDFYIVGADINERHLIATSEYLDSFYKVPYSNDPNFYKTILDICKKEKIDYILPSFDNDQKLFYPENIDLVNLKVKSLSSSKNILEFYENKKTINSKLKEFGILTPVNYNRTNILENEKYIVKPINGVGSIGVKTLTGKEIKEKIDTKNYIIQELCLEPEITLECFHIGNKLSTIARQRVDSKAGVCTKTKTFYSKELENIARNLLFKIDLPMYFNLQFMKNKNDKFVVTDVNLRLAGGMSLSHMAGWDETSAIAKYMLNYPIEEIFSTLNLNAPEQYIVRAYTDIITKSSSDVIAYDLDGTIINSFDRHLAVMDYVLKQFNIKLDLSDYIDTKRNGKNNLNYLISKGIKEDLALDIQQCWIENIEKEKFLKTDFIYSGIIEELEKNSKENKLILITARNNKENTFKQINNLGLNKYFSGIFIVDSNENTSVLKADILKKINAKCLIGDTEVDKKACTIAKIEFIFKNYGFRKEIKN